MFVMTWRSHGGSAAGISWSEALDLAPSDRDWLLTRVGQQRRQEAEAIRKARS
jgi:hypothetical protein